MGPVHPTPFLSALEQLIMSKPCVPSLGDRSGQTRILISERHISKRISRVYFTRFLHACLTKSAL